MSTSTAYGFPACVYGTVGGVVASMSSVHPLVGFFYGAAYFAASNGIRWGFEKMSLSNSDNSDKGIQDKDLTMEKMVKFAITSFVGAVAGTLFCSLLGSPLAFSAGLSLTAGMVTTTMTIAFFVKNHDLFKDAPGTEILTLRWKRA